MTDRMGVERAREMDGRKKERKKDFYHSGSMSFIEFSFLCHIHSREYIITDETSLFIMLSYPSHCILDLFFYYYLLLYFYYYL